MANSIVLKRSALPGKVPDTGSLNLGELAINTYDGKAFFKRSGNVDSIESIVTTNSITTGSIYLTKTGSFGELVVSQDGNFQRDLYVVRDVIANRDIDALGNISGSGLRIDGLLNVNSSSIWISGSTNLTGSLAMSGDLTVLGAVNARQFNINIISSSVIYQSGSTKFGDTIDDVHQFTGSVGITGSLIVNGQSVGVAPGPNTFDFNLDPSAAGTINYIQDTTGNSFVIAQTGSIDIKINNSTFLSISQSAVNITTGSITANYLHLAKYITQTGDLDFNI